MSVIPRNGDLSLLHGLSVHWGALLVVLLCIAPETARAEAPDAPTVVLFTIDFCPDCLAAKKYLSEKGIDYHEMNLDQSARAREQFDRIGGRGVPTLLINRHRLEGFDREEFEAIYQEQIP